MIDPDALAEIFGPDGPAVAATYTPAGGSPSSIYVLFDDAYTGPNALSGTVETTDPQATCRTSDVPGVRHGDTLTVGGTIYRVRGVEPDGAGVTVLRLMR